MSFRMSDIPRLPGTKWSFTSFTLAAFFFDPNIPSKRGDFDTVIAKLGYLRDLGVNAIQRVRACLAGAPSALPHSLHPDLRQLAQSSRALVRAHHPAGDSPRLVQKRARLGPQNRWLRHLLQRSQAPVRLDRHRRLHPRKTPTSL